MKTKSKIKIKTNSQAKDHRVKDIKIATKTLQDLYNDGTYSYSPGSKVYNNVCFIIPYFKKLPKDLIVDEATPPETLVWRAKDFYDGVRKRPFKITKHYPSSEFVKIGGVELREVRSENDGIQSAAHYNAVCLIPSKQFKKHAKQVERIEGYLEKKKEAQKIGDVSVNTNPSEVLKTIKKKPTKVKAKLSKSLPKPIKKSKVAKIKPKIVKVVKPIVKARKVKRKR